MPQETDNVEHVRHTWTEVEGEHTDFVRKANRFMRFFRNIQWEGRDRSTSENFGRPFVTIPIIRPQIKMVAGIMQQNPVEIVCKPRDANDFAKAAVRTDQLRYVDDDNEMEAVDAAVFLYGLITGRGCSSIDMDYTYDLMNGRIMVREEDPTTVVLDPNGKWYNGSEDMFRMRYRWLTKAEIDHHFGPGSSKDLSKDLFVSYFPRDYHYNPTGAYEVYRVLECWHKVFEPMKTLVDITTGDSWVADSDDMVEMQGENGEAVQVNVDAFIEEWSSPALEPRFHLIKRPVPKIYLTTICGFKELAHGPGKFNDCPFCQDKFPIQVYRPMFLGGKNDPIVADLIDLQRIKNVSYADYLHMLNQAANTGWVMETGAVRDPRVLKEHGATPGVVIEMNAGFQYGSSLQRLEAGNVPNLDAMLNAREEAKEVTNLGMLINDQGPKESGRAIALKQQQGTTAILPDINPFFQYKRMLGKFTLGAIEAKWTIEHAMRIVDLEQYVPMEMKQAMMQDPRVRKLAYRTIFKDYDSTRFDCVAQEQNKSESKRQANWEMTKELMEMLPPGTFSVEATLDAMDHPAKEKLKEDYRKQQMMQQQAAMGAQGGGPPPLPPGPGPTGAPPPGPPSADGGPLSSFVQPDEMGVMGRDVNTRLDGAFA